MRLCSLKQYPDQEPCPPASNKLNACLVYRRTILALHVGILEDGVVMVRKS